MNEARGQGRVRSMLGAQIVFNNRNTTIDCQVRNISAKGARLSLPELMSVPEEFDLVVPMKGKTYRARLRWRDESGAGIEFLNSDGVAAPERSPSVESSRRMAELEAENVSLRLRVLELMDALEKMRRDKDVAA